MRKFILYQHKGQGSGSGKSDGLHKAARIARLGRVILGTIQFHGDLQLNVPLTPDLGLALIVEKQYQVQTERPSTWQSGKSEFILGMATIPNSARLLLNMEVTYDCADVIPPRGGSVHENGNYSFRHGFLYRIVLLCRIGLLQIKYKRSRNTRLWSSYCDAYTGTSGTQLGLLLGFLCLGCDGSYDERAKNVTSILHFR
ncbi:hypothetical protein KM043_016900 [Ampulex compressa]|nr:hypothetical protein KM043_016900 [Ampulex compressa]